MSLTLMLILLLLILAFVLPLLVLGKSTRRNLFRLGLLGVVLLACLVFFVVQLAERG